MTSGKYCAWLLPAVLVWGTGFEQALEASEYERCDLKLGSSYDSLSAAEKKIRLSGFLDCRYQQDRRRLLAGRGNILGQVNQWRRQAAISTNSSLRNIKTVATSELQAMQKSEKEQFQTRFDLEFSQLAVQTTTDNGAGTAQKKRQLEERQGAETKEMKQQQRDQREALSDLYQQCSQGADSALDEMRSTDIQNIEQLLMSKTAALQKNYSAVRDGPMNLSPNEYIGGQVLGPVTEAVQSALAQPASSGPVDMGDNSQAENNPGCKIVFGDGTELQLDGNSGIAISEFVLEPGAEGQSSGKFSVLRGAFLFEAGWTGKGEPKVTGNLLAGNAPEGLDGQEEK